MDVPTATVRGAFIHSPALLQTVTLFCGGALHKATLVHLAMPLVTSYIHITPYELNRIERTHGAAVSWLSKRGAACAAACTLRFRSYMQECLLACACGVLCVRVSFVELESLTGFLLGRELSSVQELRLSATELRPVCIERSCSGLVGLFNLSPQTGYQP